MIFKCNNIIGIIKIIFLKKAYIFLFFLLFFISGCVGIQTNFKGIQPYARPIVKGNYSIIGDAEIMASSFKLFWILPVTPEPKINEGIDNAIIKTGGDNIIEMKLWHERQYWILGTVDIMRVNGYIIRYED